MRWLRCEAKIRKAHRVRGRLWLCLDVRDLAGKSTNQAKATAHQIATTHATSGGERCAGNRHSSRLNVSTVVVKRTRLREGVRSYYPHSNLQRKLEKSIRF